MQTTAYSDPYSGLASALIEIYGLNKSARIIAICDSKGDKLIRKYFGPALEIIHQAHDCEIAVGEIIIDESQRPITSMPSELENIITEHGATHAINIFDYNSEETPFRTSLLKVEEELKLKTIHCPGITESMFRRWGPFDVNYSIMKADVESLIKRLYEFNDFEIITGKKGEYKLELNVKGRKWMHDLHVDKGEFGNLPAGEVYIAPIENSANGKLMVEHRAGGFLLQNPLLVTFENGLVINIEGKDKKQVNNIKRILWHYKNARQIGEFAMGLNKYAQPTEDILAAEKGAGHTGVGGDKSWGAEIESEYHLDFLNKAARIYGLKDDKKILVYDNGHIPSIVHI